MREQEILSPGPVSGAKRRRSVSAPCTRDPAPFNSRGNARPRQSPIHVDDAVSVASSSLDQSSWLAAAGRSLNCGFRLVDAEGTTGPVMGAAHVAEPLRLLASREDSPLLETVRKALESDRVYNDRLGVLNLLCRR